MEVALFLFFWLMTDTKATQEKISKSLENPILEAVKKNDLSLVMKNAAQKKVIPPNQRTLAEEALEKAWK